MIMQTIKDLNRRKTRFDLLLIEDNNTDALLIQSHIEKSTDFNLQIVQQLSQALECLNSQSFDVILLDLNLPDAFGLEGLIKLRHHLRKIPIVVLTGVDDKELGIMALQRGAQDYLIKGLDNSRVMQSVRYAIERTLVYDPESSMESQYDFDINRSWLSSRAIPGVENDRKARQHQLLTERELQVLELLGKGYSNREIAFHLAISLTTVKTHMSSILQKLLVSDRTNAVIEAQRQGLI